VNIENYMVATSQIAQTTLRSVLGQRSLDELLSEREKINGILRASSTSRQRRGASRCRSWS
jgi:regulator of protease activity HflC (stomatin/prohibitin superfamily)